MSEDKKSDELIVSQRIQVDPIVIDSKEAAPLVALEKQIRQVIQNVLQLSKDKRLKDRTIQLTVELIGREP